MSDNAPVPGLDTLGWITTTDIKCDRLLSHFLLAEYSQTSLFPGEVASLPWLIQEYKDSTINLTERTEQTLQKYFGAYFTKTTVQVKHRDENNGTVTLRIFVEVTDDQGKVFSASKAAEIEGSRIKRVATLNNEGQYVTEYELNN